MNRNEHYDNVISDPQSVQPVHPEQIQMSTVPQTAGKRALVSLLFLYEFTVDPGIVNDTGVHGIYYRPIDKTWVAERKIN